MSKATNNPTKVIITGRLSYANVFEPKSFNGQEEKYSTAILIPKDDKETVALIESAIEAAKEDGKNSKWKGKVPANFKNPLRDGDEERPDDENYAGMYFVNANSKRAPQVVTRFRDANGKPIRATEEDVYSGCWANVSVNFFPYDTSGNRGVGAGLNNIQKVKDDMRLGGASSAADEFDFEEEEFDDMFA